MKRTLIKGLAVLIALGGANIALAENGTNASSTRPIQKIMEARKEAREDIKDIRQNLASTTKEFRGEIKDNVKDNIKKRTDNQYNKMLERFQATIDRETEIMSKINTRIEKIKTEGGNTTEAEKLVVTAKMHLDMATSSLANLKTLADKQTELENASTTVKALRDGLTAMKKAGAEIEKHLREAHQSLQKTIGVLRGVSQLKNKNATSTSSNN